MIEDFKLNLSLFIDKPKLVVKKRWKKVVGVLIYFIGIASGISFLGLIMHDKNVINYALLDYGFDEKSIEEYKLNEFIKKIEDLKIDKKEKVEKIEEFLEDLLYYTGPCYLAVKYKEVYESFFSKIEELSKKPSDFWSKFHYENFD